MVLALIDERSDGLDRLLDDRFDVQQLVPQLDLAVDDARDVEQVVDEPTQMLDLPLNDLLAPAQVLLRDLGVLARSAALVMAEIGFRSSWASMARNSSLRRSASRSATSIRL